RATWRVRSRPASAPRPRCSRRWRHEPDPHDADAVSRVDSGRSGEVRCEPARFRVEIPKCRKEIVVKRQQNRKKTLKLEKEALLRLSQPDLQKVVGASTADSIVFCPPRESSDC